MTPDGFVDGLDPHFVSLSAPFVLADGACEALRTAGTDGDVTDLDTLTAKLAVPQEHSTAG